MAPIRITQAELLDALSVAARGDTPDEARTMRELIKDTGLGRERVGRALQDLHEQSRLAVHNVQRTAIDGVQRWTTAYTILPAKPA